MSFAERRQVSSFKVDENLPVEAAQVLRLAGYDALTVLEQSMGGTLDGPLASVCREEGRALVTLDIDFSNIQSYPPSEYRGIIVLRLQHQDKASVLMTLQGLVPMLIQEPLDGCLWVVDEHRIRIRQ
jgi:predicted nuclease of predicted toxin-antitoxin system